jgi:hypothetical protein
MPRGATHGHLLTSNDQRAREAGERNSAAAVRALAVLGSKTPDRWRQVAKLRILYPYEPWAVLAARAGMSKFEAASCFRRLLQAAGLR